MTLPEVIDHFRTKLTPIRELFGPSASATSYITRCLTTNVLRGEAGGPIVFGTMGRRPGDYAERSAFFQHRQLLSCVNQSRKGYPSQLGSLITYREL